MTIPQLKKQARQLGLSFWKLRLQIDHGYFGSSSYELICTSDGLLEFVPHERPYEILKQRTRQSDTLKAADLQKIEALVQQFRKVEEVNRSYVDDGGSFNLKVWNVSGGNWELSVYHSFEDEELDAAMDQLRFLLNEPNFVKD